ncbi:MAG: DMT family transporter, partial [Candidatus Roizmanbacteria bacterium]|nr:DMT family transporter [Candidatus Roizmanbacteria bacterium]
MNPVLALIIANVIWGMASPIFKFALTNIPPFTLAFIRFFFAGLIFLPIALNKWQKLTTKQWMEIILVGFFGITINISFFFLGLAKTESINVPIIASSGPVFIYLLSIFFLREKPKLRVLSGMLIALAGVLFIILSPLILDGKRFVLGAIEGNLFILIATFGSVLQTIFGRNILKKISAIQVATINFLFGSLTFLPFIPNELANWDISFLNFAGWLGIIFGVFFSSALAYFLFYYGISKLKAQDVGIFTYIDPLAAIIVAAPLLHEYPNMFYILGGILIFGGIYFAEGRIHWHP